MSRIASWRQAPSRHSALFASQKRFEERLHYNQRMAGSGKLTIVPTPIGNMGDITLRALEVLQEADAVLCEDTRVTGKLLAHIEVRKPLIRVDENTIRERAEDVLQRIQGGSSLAYCTDAGTPGVSDPGMVLVRAAREAGLAVEVLPGASAATTAYVASGFASTRFLFAGFLPKREAERATLLDSLRTLDAALIFYESPHRLTSSLALIAEVFPNREVAVCRELTKLHEEVFVDRSGEVSRAFAVREEQAPIKGEIAIIVDGPSIVEGEEARSTAEAAARQLASALTAEGKRLKEVRQQLVDVCGISRNAAYEMALAAQEEQSAGE